MSSPQSEPAADKSKPAPKAKKPLLTPSQVENAERAKLDAAERASRDSLGDAQIALARNRRLQKAAKKDPAIAEILGQNEAQLGIIEQLRQDNDALKADNAELREQLAAALKPKA